MQTNPNSAYEVGFYQGLNPPPILTVSQWAERNRILSSVSSPNPGKWKNSKTPYLREPMDALSSHSTVELVDMMFGAQLGKTEAILNWAGYKIDHSPGPMMLVQPTSDMAKRFSKQRISTLSETPSILEKLGTARTRDSGNTQLMKDFPGGTLIITGANSPVGLSSAPVGALALDETDRFPDSTEEGDPVELAIARTKNFVNAKVLRTSTPTTMQRSRIYKGWIEGDMSRYHVPCPHCKQLQVLKWGDPTSNYGIKWTPGDPTSAYYLCEINGCVIEEYHKDWMLQEENGAKWIAEKPELSHYHRSFHLPTIYSPWYSWEKAVRQFLKAKNNPDRLRSFINTYMGEVWVEKEGDTPDFKMIYGRRESYKSGVAPNGSYLLTGACDVQKNRIEALVMAWGKGREAWVIDRREFLGSPEDLSESGPWSQVDSFLHEQFPHENGMMLPLRMVGIDSGFLSQQVYTFCRRYQAGRVVATRGFDHLKMVLGTPTAVDINLAGKKIRRGLRMFPIGSSHLKDEIYAILKMQMPTEKELAENGFPEGFLHFGEFLDDEFFEQLCSEQKTYRIEKGFRKYFYEKLRERNEALDLVVINRAMASLVGIDRMDDEDWIELAKDFQPIETREEAVQSHDPDYIPRKKSSFWS